MYLCPWCQFLLERGRPNVLRIPFKEVARHVRRGGDTCAGSYHLNVYVTLLFLEGGVELELFQLLMHYRQIAPPTPQPPPSSLQPHTHTHTHLPPPQIGLFAAD